MKHEAYPRQVILVTSSEKIIQFGKEVKKDNIMTLSWHMPVSHNPKMYAIAVSKKRFSYNLIKKSKSFCVNFMPYSLSEEVLFIGKNSGDHIDKFEKTGLHKEECEAIEGVRIREALSYFECELVEEIKAGDHVIFVGRVVGTFNNRNDKRPYQVDGDKFTTTLD